MAERRGTVVPGGEMYLFAFDPKPGGAETLGPPAAFCGSSAWRFSYKQSDCEGGDVDFKWFNINMKCCERRLNI